MAWQMGPGRKFEVVSLTSLSCHKKVSDGGSLVGRTSERVWERKTRRLLNGGMNLLIRNWSKLWWVMSVRMWRVGEPKFGGVAAFREGPHMVTFCVFGLFF